MKTVFIGGSRHVSRLSAEVKGRLNNVIKNGHRVVVGDANGADKNKLPRAMAVAAISSGSTGTLLKKGIVRNDGWGHTTDQDEGAAVYGSATPGAITLTAPSTSGDIVTCIGHLLEQNVLDFNPSPIGVEVE